ncbi:PhnD/SsuA/transferrin family substrate-binding protein [Acidiphilium acidophilum]|uniref:phosphate/phosphite/phosphonate ABC transporter substrate-binding protein n=1 Tax=Acidiphilium acidophilum TaxID=76588 RepID=UPI002E8E6374|nr:PhnD/SsuA/transferrin family substrate-binding protein [Acidiphilium acidophilum]
MSEPVASLGMYDIPALRPALDRFWHVVSETLRNADTPIPATLSHDAPLDQVWRNPHLILAQTCGLPLMTELPEVQLVATPCYDLPECDGPLYRSLIVVPASSPAATLADLRDRRAAINGWNSQSGMNALRAVIAPIAPITGTARFFSAVEVTSSHRASLAALQSGRADVAAIDCVTHGLLARYEPASLTGTRILARSPPTPGLPLITAAGTSPDLLARLRDALARAASDATGKAIHWRGLESLTRADYTSILAMRADAVALGYPELR